MNDAMFEQEMKNFDYSMIHPVKEKILGNLLKMQRETKANPHISRSITLKRINLDGLNLVAAAGDASLEGAQLVNKSTPIMYNHFK